MSGSFKEKTMLLFSRLIVHLLPAPNIMTAPNALYPRLYDSCMSEVVRWHRSCLARLIFEYPLEEADRAISAHRFPDMEERHLSLS